MGEESPEQFVDQALVDAVQDQSAGNGLSSVAIRLLRETPYAEWPRLGERAELHNIAALAELRRQAEARINRVPLESLTLAQVATTIADRLSSDSYPSFILAELRAHAWKDRGMALGYLARYGEALDALDHADEILKPFDALAYVQAHVDLVRASVLRNAGRFDESLAALEACASVFERQRDRRRQLLCRNAEAAVYYRMGRFREALQAWLAIVDMATEVNDREMLAGIHNNISHSLIDLGEFDAAEQHLADAIALFTELGQDVHVARSRMALGRLFVRKGEVNRGIDELHSVRELFLVRNLVEEAGLCGLDIVEAHLLRGAFIEAEALSRQILREFTAAHLSERASTALQYLSESIAARNASAATVDHVRRFILTLRAKPESDFAAIA